MHSRDSSAYHLASKTDMDTNDYIINARENNQVLYVTEEESLVLTFPNTLLLPHFIE